VHYCALLLPKIGVSKHLFLIGNNLFLVIKGYINLLANNVLITAVCVPAYQPGSLHSTELTLCRHDEVVKLIVSPRKRTVSSLATKDITVKLQPTLYSRTYMHAWAHVVWSKKLNGILKNFRVLLQNTEHFEQHYTTTPLHHYTIQSEILQKNIDNSVVGSVNQI
jgi:hypothetical protein